MKQPKKQQWNIPHKYNQSKQSERYLEHGKMDKDLSPCSSYPTNRGSFTMTVVPQPISESIRNSP